MVPLLLTAIYFLPSKGFIFLPKRGWEKGCIWNDGGEEVEPSCQRADNSKFMIPHDECLGCTVRPTAYIVQGPREHNYFCSKASVRWCAGFEGKKQGTLSPWKVTCFADLVNKSLSWCLHVKRMRQIWWTSLSEGNEDMEKLRNMALGRYWGQEKNPLSPEPGAWY